MSNFPFFLKDTALHKFLFNSFTAEFQEIDSSIFLPTGNLLKFNVYRLSLVKSALFVEPLVVFGSKRVSFLIDKQFKSRSCNGGGSELAQMPNSWVSQISPQLFIIKRCLIF